MRCVKSHEKSFIFRATITKMTTDFLRLEFKKALGTLNIPVASIDFDRPATFYFGDYTTNFPLAFAKSRGLDPKECATKITNALLQNKHPYIEHAEAAGPGFINIRLSRDFFIKELEAIFSNARYGSSDVLKNKKVFIEYTDPNPFKEFHIGHLLSNAVGESVSRIVEFFGAEVKRANYQGDVGLHVAKAVWGMMHNETDLGKAYAHGAIAYEKEEQVRKEIAELNKKIYEKSDHKVNILYDLGRQKSLKEFEKIYALLGTKFDFYFFESVTGELGKKLVLEYLKKGVFHESEGAIVFRGEESGLHTRVFITREGLPTYEAKELGLLKLKYDAYPYDFSIIVTGNEVKEYFKVVLEAIKRMFPGMAEKATHVTHGMLRLPSGKMSSRTGDVISAESLIDEVKKQLKDKVEKSEHLLVNKNETLTQIVIGSIKYSILKQDASKDIVFDFEKSISFVGNSGPYLQYTHARCMSILEKAKEAGISKDVSAYTRETPNIVRALIHFPEVVEKALKFYAPHYIATYLYELAQEFNSFYAEKQIIDKKDETSPYKIAITSATGQVLKNGLYLLGISAPEKM